MYIFLQTVIFFICYMKYEKAGENNVEENMSINKYSKDLKGLEDIASKQNNKINLSTILITLKCDMNEISEVLDYFTEKDIEVLNEDVEPDPDDSNEIDKKVTPFDPSKIDIKMDKITIDSIIKRIINNELEFDSSFQRKSGLWSKKQKSQLIESIFLKIPLPAFYFDASNDDKWQIIDGLQRIGTIKEYVVEHSFSLTGLEFLKDLEESKFDDLPRSLQRRIEETNLNAYLVNPSTPKNVKFNIFKRINTGGLILEPQEIRNALYQGKATEFLLRMSKMEEFKQATDHSIKVDRMLDREFCLRYIAFTCLNLEEYNGVLDDFLNSGMDFLARQTDEKLGEIQIEFAKVMNDCRKIFGKFAFRRMNTEERRGPVNKALFESWSLIIKSLNSNTIENIVKNKEKLWKKYTKLCDDYMFQNAIRAADKNSVKSRIKMIRKIVMEVLEE